MNKNRFWLKVGYWTSVEFFQDTTKIESCHHFVDLESELQAVTDL